MLRCGGGRVRSLVASAQAPARLSPAVPTLAVQQKRSMRLGAGGRSSVSGIVATVFGCSGFLGRYVVNRLGRVGSQIIVPSRMGELSTRHLKLMGDVGQVIPVDFHLKDRDMIRQSVARSNLAINCIGKFWDTRNFTLEQTIVEGTQRIAEVCKEAGVEHFVHVSALGASKTSKSRFLRLKALSEEAARSVYPNCTIVRPGTMIGPEDRLLNWHAQIHRSMAFNPIFHNNAALLSPVFVGDVSNAIMIASEQRDKYEGKVIEAAGPEVLTQVDLVRLVGDVAEWEPRLIHLSSTLSRLFGRACNYIPDHFVLGDMSSDRIEMFSESSLVSARSPTLLHLSDLGIQPQSVEVAGRVWLKMWRKGTPFDSRMPKA